MRALVLAVLVACSSSKSPNELPGDGLTTPEYVSAGVPAIDQTWTSEQLVAAATALANLATDHPERLPRHGSAKSGAVFARITEPTVVDASAAVNDQFIAHATRYEAVNQLSKLYVVNAMAAPNREWLALTGVLLAESAALAGLVDRFMAQFAADDPTRAVREGGLAKMKLGWTGLLLGGLMVTADLRVAEPARIALATQLEATFPAIYPQLDAPQQAALREQLGKLHDGLKPGVLRDALPALP